MEEKYNISLALQTSLHSTGSKP